jgi:hypothetical protein
MSDLLAASSLLTTVIAILFSLWYAELVGALALEVESKTEDNVGKLRQVQGVLVSKALPLTVFSACVALVFAPDCLKIILEALAQYDRDGTAAVHRYDSVRMAFLLVVFASAYLALYLVVLTGKLLALRGRLAA